jgi:serine protease inhibitor
MPEAAASVSSSLNDFGFRLLRKLTDGAGRNTIVSPFSVFSALAMAYNGAEASTKTAMATTLGIGSLADDQLNAPNRAIAAAIRGADPGLRMEIANALWMQSGFSILPSFTAVNRGFYDATAEQVDFAGEPERAERTINGWVNELTARFPRLSANLIGRRDLS